jgi:hypothetical protein
VAATSPKADRLITASGNMDDSGFCFSLDAPHGVADLTTYTIDNQFGRLWLSEPIDGPDSIDASTLSDQQQSK